MSNIINLSEYKRGIFSDIKITIQTEILEDRSKWYRWRYSNDWSEWIKLENEP